MKKIIHILDRYNINNIIDIIIKQYFNYNTKRKYLSIFR